MQCDHAQRHCDIVVYHNVLQSNYDTDAFEVIKCVNLCEIEARSHKWSVWTFSGSDHSVENAANVMKRMLW